MANKNYFSVNRKFFDNPLWTSEKFTKGQAWLDLFGLANHSDGYFIKRGMKVDLKRGQIGRSELTFSARWKWSRDKVRRFLKWLESESMILLKQDNKTTIITICNYNIYQPNQEIDNTSNNTANDTPNDTPNDTQTIRRNKKEKKKDICNIHFEKLFNDYPNQNSLKSQTLKNYQSAKKKFNFSDEEMYTACMNSYQKQIDDNTKEEYIFKLSNVLGLKYRENLPELLNYKPPQKTKYSYL